MRCGALELDSRPRDLFVLVALLLSIPGFVEHLVNERLLCLVWKDLLGMTRESVVWGRIVGNATILRVVEEGQNA